MQSRGRIGKARSGCQSFFGIPKEAETTHRCVKITKKDRERETRPNSDRRLTAKRGRAAAPFDPSDVYLAVIVVPEQESGNFLSGSEWVCALMGPQSLSRLLFDKPTKEPQA
jgi:hypothetical protein